MFKQGTKKKETLAKYVKLESLPPTSDAVKYHFYRVYLQVQKSNDLPAEDWGWKRGQILTPIRMSKPVAPKNLIQKIFCNCKKDCTSKQCSCKTTGLLCTDVCGSCTSEKCKNFKNNCVIENEAEDNIVSPSLPEEISDEDENENTNLDIESDDNELSEEEF